MGGMLIVLFCCFVFFFKQKTAYEILTCDWSSDVCSSDLVITWLLLNANLNMAVAKHRLAKESLLPKR